MLTCKTASQKIIAPLHIIKSQIGILNPYDLHKRLVNNYLLCKKGSSVNLKRDESRDKRDIDIIKENHKFLWDEEETPESWEARLAKKYYDKLFKEYCICDLSRYKENKIAMRWRIEDELIIGKGQFICGEKHCKNSEDLKSWEVNFAYFEEGVKKNALVKARLCPSCSKKLNHHHMKREAKRIKKRRRAKDSNSEDTEDKNKKLKGDVEDYTLEEQSQTNKPETNSGESSDVTENIWKQDNIKEKTIEEEFDEYLDDLFF